MLVACRNFNIFVWLFVIYSLKVDQPKQQKLRKNTAKVSHLYFWSNNSALFEHWNWKLQNQMLYFTLSSSLNPHLGIFFYRFTMVVRKNVLEYIITLVVVKNKVRLKKFLKKFQIWQSSIPQINLSITSLRLIPKFRPVFDNQC